MTSIVTFVNIADLNQIFRTNYWRSKNLKKKKENLKKKKKSWKRLIGIPNFILIRHMINAPYQLIIAELIEISYTASDKHMYVYLYAVRTSKKQKFIGRFPRHRCSLRLPDTVISNTHFKKC